MFGHPDAGLPKVGIRNAESGMRNPEHIESWAKAKITQLWSKQPWTMFLSVYTGSVAWSDRRNSVQVEKLNILSKSRYNIDLILVLYYF